MTIYSYISLYLCTTQKQMTTVYMDSTTTTNTYIETSRLKYDK